jgi:hypothetical protein
MVSPGFGVPLGSREAPSFAQKFPMNLRRRRGSSSKEKEREEESGDRVG